MNNPILSQTADETSVAAVSPEPTISTTLATTFDDLGLIPELLRAVKDTGYTAPTPIQAQAIPIVLAGHDDMGGAQTGTGFANVGETVNVVTSASGVHRLDVTWSTGTAFGESDAEFCLAPPSITLRHTCNTATGGINWYASNTGGTATSVDWSLDEGALTLAVNFPPK